MVSKVKKTKRLTAAEKKRRAEWREEWRKEGILPPVKRPLNRKKFIADAREDYAQTLGIDDLIHVCSALTMMTSSYRPTLENIGAAKVMKLACEIKRFYDECRADARKGTYSELLDRLDPIVHA